VSLGAAALVRLSLRTARLPHHVKPAAR
jgi:hypothetical protein